MSSRKCKCFEKWRSLTDTELGCYMRAEQGKSHWINEIQHLTDDNKKLRAEVDKLRLDATNVIIERLTKEIEVYKKALKQVNVLMRETQDNIRDVEKETI
jgi:hypothetical protein